MAEPTVIAKAGPPVAAPFPTKKEEATPAAAATAEPTTAPAAANPEPAEPQKLPELTDEQLKQLLEGKGIVVDNIETLKEKLKPAEKVLTEEEKKASEAKFEQRMVEHFIGDGGTVEQYAALKSVASMDAKTLAKESTVKELREAGFDDKEIDNIIKERYYQIDPNALVHDPEAETEEEFKARKALLEKKAKFGTAKLESRNLHLKQNAETILNSLRETVKAKDSEAQREAALLSNVDKSLKEMPRELTIELGEVDNKKIDPVQFKITDAHIATVKDILSDPAKRKQYFFNQDISTDIGKAIKIILRNEAMESMARAAFLEGGTRQVREFQKRFPSSATDLGVGGPQQQASGKIVKAGEPQIVQPKK